MVRVVIRASQISLILFSITEGVRTLARQLKLVADGKSKTEDSPHLNGDAVDVMARPNGYGKRGSWARKHYCTIAEAMRQSAIECDVGIRWGGAWHISDIRAYDGTMAEAMAEYIALRKSQGRKPFVDAVHFELTDN